MLQTALGYQIHVVLVQLFLLKVSVSLLAINPMRADVMLALLTLLSFTHSKCLINIFDE